MNVCVVCGGVHCCGVVFIVSMWNTSPSVLSFSANPTTLFFLSLKFSV